MAVPAKTHIAIVPTLKINGETKTARESGLARMRIHRTLHAAGVATFTFKTNSLGELTSGSFDIGVPIEVHLPKGASALKQVFKGEIVSVGFDSVGGSQQAMALRVEARDPSHRLSSAAEFSAHLNQKRSDVAAAIAGRHNLTFEGDSTDAQVPYLLQTCSDHAMLTQMAHELGWEWFTDAGKLYFRKRGTEEPVTLSPSYQGLLQFSARFTGTPVASSLKINVWSPGADPVVGDGSSTVSSPGAAALGSSASFVSHQYGKAKDAFGQDHVIANEPTLAAEADDRAGALATELVGRGLYARGRCAANADLEPGKLVKIENFTASVDGTYYVTSVTHDFAPRRGVRTVFESAGHRVEPAPEAGPGTGASWGQLGLAVGKVSNLNDPEDKGRVKVQFAVLGEQGESDWAWVVSPGAGASRGIDFRPELNDEVVVGFEAGNPRQAFVLGGLWTSTDLPDTAAVASGEVVKRTIKSRMGHSITISDGDDAAASVVVALADGTTKLELTEKGMALETSDSEELTIKAGGSSIVFGKQGALTIKASKVVVEAEQTAGVEAKGGDLTLKGVNAKLESSANFEVKGGAMGKVESSAPLTLKGAIVQVN